MLLQIDKKLTLKLESVQRNICEKDRKLNQSFKLGTKKIRKLKAIAKSLHNQISSVIKEYDYKMVQLYLIKEEGHSYLSDNSLSTCDSERKDLENLVKIALTKGTKEEKITFLNKSRILFKKAKK